MRPGSLVLSSMLIAYVLVVTACNAVGDCPAKASVTPGGPCSTDQLQCPYDLTTPGPTCNGSSSLGIASSCICTGGAWSCSAGFCDGGADAAADGSPDAPASGDAQPDAAAG